jgi:segregation and condensation protein B
MDQNETKHIVEAALLAANASLSFDRLVELFSARGVDVDRDALREALKALTDDYAERQIELKETASGFRIQIRSTARDWLQPLFEERAPRYTRALLETLALIAYRQPITRAEIEEVRGVVVSSNIVRTLMERGWIRVVGQRDVPGKPSMLGTTREFLDYFGLKRLDDLPPLAEIRELGPGSDPQSDFVDELSAMMRESEVSVEVAEDQAVEAETEAEEASQNVVSIQQSEG